ncbi:MAG: 4-hydroxythreonine-4-phosphate dehydrogenase PdxA [Gemmatimonadetes bacterium]|nr:4-hydroxythreonine-4-phosphate dehydrogenase PdxA [Gemmatimonadota bacterium]
MSRPIAITLGDPRGIGPEIVAKALGDPRVAALGSFVLVGPSGTGLEVRHDVGRWHPGTSSVGDAGRLAGLAIERAVALALAGEVGGIVTAPIDKAALLAGGYDFPGHTEMLAALTGCRVAMMLASDKLRVVLATTHIALRDVPAAVTREAILQAAEVTRDGLRRWFGIAEPRIALCAINPHAGDGGRFGREDETILAPVAREAGISGPFPADTVFVRAMRGAFDAVIAPYHDVGMTAIKVASFGHAVNVTLGLPFPRTSPDHGTALDIAGQGIADAGSMVEAIVQCARIVARLGATSEGTREGAAGAA